MADDQDVLRLLKRTNVLRENGHYVLVSGRHSETYVGKMTDATTFIVSRLGRKLAARCAHDNIEVVIGPETGGALLAEWTRYHLAKATHKAVAVICAHKDGTGGFILSPETAEFVAGKITIIVDDTATTGGSIKKVVEVARAAGAHVVKVLFVVNRGNVTSHDVADVPIEQLVTLSLVSYTEEECLLHGPCSRGVSVNTDVGHGSEFLARKKT